MEIARLITMRKNLYVELSAAAEDLSRKYEYLILKGKVELLDEIIAEEKISYELFVENSELHYSVPQGANKDEAISLSQMWMRENFISEAELCIYRGMKLCETIHIYV